MTDLFFLSLLLLSLSLINSITSSIRQPRQTYLERWIYALILYMFWRKRFSEMPIGGGRKKRPAAAAFDSVTCEFSDFFGNIGILVISKILESFVISVYYARFVRDGRDKK